MGYRPGGGPQSRQVVSKPMRTGGAARPGGAGQIGTSIGTHVTEKRRETDYRGVPVFNGGAISLKLGNQIAAETTCGVGGSRSVYKTGSQQTHGSVNPGNPPPRSELFPGWSSKK